MIRHIAGFSLVLALAGCASGGATTEAPQGAGLPQGSQQPIGAGGSSVLDGVYTASQAGRGEDIFQGICSQCHGQNEFSGARFRTRWQGETVGDIYEFVSTMMPDGDPGSLEDHEYADVVAYLLSLNRYPTGSTDLPFDPSALGTIRIEPAAPN